MLDSFKSAVIYDTKIVNGKILQIDVTKRMKFLSGWQITINALLQFWNDIEKPSYVSFTHKLNQDCPQNLFGNFKSLKWKKCRSNTYSTFLDFKKIIFYQFFQTF